MIAILELIETFRGSRGGIRCKCMCDCGNIIDVPYKRYLTKHVKSCPDCNSKAKPSHLIGKRFNSLTVIGFDHYSDSRKDYWLCRCDCGKETVVQGYNLKSGAVKSCGCGHKLCQLEDISGYNDGNIEVIRFIERKDMQSLFECRCLRCNSIFIASSNNIKKGHYHSCGCVKHSFAEDTVAEYLSNVTQLEVLRNKRILPRTEDKRNNLEIDIYLPALRLGIEYNGSVFHSSVNSVFKDIPVTYHQEKFLLAKSMGIHLINIFDVDWQNNQDKIKSYLLDLVRKPIKLYARQCEIRKISSSEANSFCDRYHLQGSTRANSICYGLYFNDELYSVMTFSHVRYKSNSSEYELYRYCVKSGYSIIGGASKLFNHFLLDYCPTKVVSYSDNDYFLGDIYPKLGFRYDKQCALSYFWFGDGVRKREQCQVHKLKEAYPELYQKAIDEGASNKENYIMTALGYKKVFRSGNTRWIYENQ